MTITVIDRLITEFAHLADPKMEPALEAVRMAILLEDVVGISLTDDQIDPAIMGDPAAIRSLLTESLRSR